MNEVIVFQGNMNNVFKKSKRIIKDLGLLDLIVDEQGKLIYARSKTTHWTWGDDYIFVFDYYQRYYISVEIMASSKQFLDLGSFKRISKIIDAYEKAMNEKTVRMRDMVLYDKRR